MYVALLVVMLQLMPNGMVKKITEEVRFPTPAACQAVRDSVMNFHITYPQPYTRLVSVECKEHSES